MIHPHNPGAACTESCSPIDYYPTAMKILAADFLRLCPQMKKLAIDAEAMVSRYYHYCAQGQRPPLDLPAKPKRSDLVSAIQRYSHWESVGSEINDILDRLEFAPE